MGRPTRHKCNVPLLSIIAWLKKSMFCETSPILYFSIAWFKNLLCYMIPSSNITGSNITDRGAAVRDRGTLIGNFVIPKYITDRGAVVRQPLHTLTGTNYISPQLSDDYTALLLHSVSTVMLHLTQDEQFKQREKQRTGNDPLITYQLITYQLVTYHYQLVNYPLINY